MGAGDDKGDALGVQAEPATGIIEGAFVHDDVQDALQALQELLEEFFSPHG